MKKVLVLGGGLAGVEAAITLNQKLQGTSHQVQLISDRDFLYIYPASIWLTVGKRTLEDLCLPIPQLAELRGFKFLQARVESIQTRSRLVKTDQEDLTYDYLVIALGGSKLAPQGIEHTRSVCRSPQDGLDIQQRFFQLVKQGHGTIACGYSGNPEDATAVRGGPMFEVIFNFDHYLRQQGLRNQFQLIFFTPSPNPGQRLGEKGMAQISQVFRDRNIQTITGKKIQTFTPEGVVFQDGSQIAADLTVFTPGLTGNPVLQNSDLALTAAGFIPVNQHTQVLEDEHCYALGDSSYFDGPTWRARQGHLAEVMARTAAENIVSQLHGETPTATFEKEMNLLCMMDMGDEAIFVYRDEKKSMAPRGAWAHWAKLAWEQYYKLNKYGKVPRLI
jgi:sulfide:quinone oxidoreductase